LRGLRALPKSGKDVETFCGGNVCDEVPLFAREGKRAAKAFGSAPECGRSILFRWRLLLERRTILSQQKSLPAQFDNEKRISNLLVTSLSFPEFTLDTIRSMIRMRPTFLAALAAAVSFTIGFSTARGELLFSDSFDTGGQRVVTTIAPNHTTAWLVVKLNFDTGTQDLFVSPTDAAATPDATLAMTPEFQASGFSQVLLHEGLNDRGSAFVFDELRVGRSFADIRIGE
jgi:hypothetical protein